MNPATVCRPLPNSVLERATSSRLTMNTEHHRKSRSRTMTGLCLAVVWFWLPAAQTVDRKLGEIPFERNARAEVSASGLEFTLGKYRRSPSPLTGIFQPPTMELNLMFSSTTAARPMPSFTPLIRAASNSFSLRRNTRPSSKTCSRDNSPSSWRISGTRNCPGSSWKNTCLSLPKTRGGGRRHLASQRPDSSSAFPQCQGNRKPDRNLCE